MPIETFADNAASPLATSVVTTPAPGTQETWTVNSTTSFPQGAGQARFVIDNEIVIGTTPPASGTTIVVTRGAEGTTPAIHNAGALLKQEATAGSLSAILSQALLKVVQYSPSSPVNYNSTTTLTALDTVNLRNSFTCPPSGNVMMMLSGMLNNANFLSSSNLKVGVLNGSTQMGPLVSVTKDTSTLPNSFVFAARIYIPLLTPSTTYNFDFAIVSASPITSAITVDNGTLWAPATITMFPSL